MPASAKSDRIVETQASSVSSVPCRRSRTRCFGSTGGASVLINAQHRSKILARRSCGTLMDSRFEVQSADTKSTNCRSGIPGLWTSNCGMAGHYQVAFRWSQPGLSNGEWVNHMVTISLMGQLQTADGERDVACELASPMTVRQVIQRQGVQLRHLLQLIREKKVLVTINKKIASDDSLVHDGDAIRLVGHDGFGGSGLGPTHS